MPVKTKDLEACAFTKDVNEIQGWSNDTTLSSTRQENEIFALLNTTDGLSSSTQL